VKTDAPSAVASSRPNPRAVYQERLAIFRSLDEQLQRRLAWLGNGRFALFGLGVILLVLVVPLRALSPLWLLAAVVPFIFLSIQYQRAARRGRHARRAVGYYQHGLDRLDDCWAGRGIAGSEYLDEGHLYAADLDLFGRGSLFERICDARTRIGRATLARWLAAPAPPDEVRARQAVVQELRGRLAWREQLALLGAEVPEGIDTARLAAWGKEGAARPSPWARRLAPCMLAITLLALFAWQEGWLGRLGVRLPMPFLGWEADGAGLLVVGLALLLQAGYALLVRPRVRRAMAGLEGHSDELLQLAGILTRIERETFTSPRLLQLQGALRVGGLPPSKRLAQLVRLIEMHDSTHNSVFAFIAPLMLWNTQVGLVVEGWRRETGPALERWLAVIGEVEALTALSGYAYENPTDPFPEIVAGGPLYEADGLGHPLLPRRDCVANDIRLGPERRLLVVSGSNMSGKTTFLRTVGVNAVLALAGAPVRAVRLRLAPLAIGATLRIQDSLQAGYSRFFAEITRLRQIVELTRGPLPVLFLLDEILHGTNSHDRRIGAEAVLRSLLQRPSLGLVTTHDLALAQIADQLAPLAANVHFADTLGDGQLHFDYRLQPGVVRHSNALALMRAVGLSVDADAEPGKSAG
jgi:hypothetical protein